jgi:CheY-like chemotaxis protein
MGRDRYQSTIAGASRRGILTVNCQQRKKARMEDELSGLANVLVSVVDDDESVRESLPDLLKELGYAAEPFPSAEKFLESDVVGRTQCLLLDVTMPGMSGPELKRELARRGIDIAIIFITAHVTRQSARACWHRAPWIVCSSHSARTRSSKRCAPRSQRADGSLTARGPNADGRASDRTDTNI